MTEQEMVGLIQDLIEHLEYCGWGDRWERDVSEELRIRATAFLERYPPPKEAS